MGTDLAVRTDCRRSDSVAAWWPVEEFCCAAGGGVVPGRAAGVFPRLAAGVCVGGEAGAAP